MANYTTGTATGAGAANNFFVALSTHLQANGWTEHDVISASAGTRDVVFRGAALDATADLRPFVRITQTSTTNWNVLSYSDWDTTTHAGVNVAGAAGTSTMTLQDTSFAYVIWANGYAFAFAVKLSGVWMRSYAGMVRRGLAPSKSGIYKTTGALSIGNTSVNLSGGTPANLKVGQKILIMNYAHSSASANASNAELVTIAGTHAGGITVSALTKAYDTGAIVAENLPLAMVQAGSNSGTLMVSTAYFPLHLDGTRTSATGQTASHNYAMLATEGNVDPDDVTLQYGPGVISLSSSTASKAGLRGYPYGYAICAGGAQSLDDIGDDGTYTYLLLAAGTSEALLVGPRET